MLSPTTPALPTKLSPVPSSISSRSVSSSTCSLFTPLFYPTTARLRPFPHLSLLDLFMATLGTTLSDQTLVVLPVWGCSAHPTGTPLVATLGPSHPQPPLFNKETGWHGAPCRCARRQRAQALSRAPLGSSPRPFGTLAHARPHDTVLKYLGRSSRCPVVIQVLPTLDCQLRFWWPRAPVTTGFLFPRSIPCLGGSRLPLPYMGCPQER